MLQIFRMPHSLLPLPAARRFRVCSTHSKVDIETDSKDFTVAYALSAAKIAIQIFVDFFRHLFPRAVSAL